MTDTPTVPTLADLLAWRREFHARPGPAGGAGTADLVYVLARFLVRRFDLAHVFVDDEPVADLFRAHAGDRADGFTVNGGPPPAAGDDPDRFTALYVLNPARHPPAAWAPAAVAAGSLVLAYGSGAVDDGEGVRGLAGLADGAAFVSLAARTPALWHLAGHLVVAAGQRAAAAAAVRTFAAHFAGDDLDPLRLAEEAISLRAAVHRLSGPGTATADVTVLKRTVANLEEDVLALRRTILNQELTIGVLTAKTAPKPPANPSPIQSPADRPVSNGPATDPTAGAR